MVWWVGGIVAVSYDMERKKGCCGEVSGGWGERRRRRERKMLLGSWERSVRCIVKQWPININIARQNCESVQFVPSIVAKTK